MLAYTFNARQPIFVPHGQPSTAVTVLASSLTAITQRQCLPMPDYSLGTDTEGYRLTQLKAIQDGALVYQGVLHFNDEAHKVVITATVLYSEPPIHYAQDYNITHLYTPEVRALGSLPGDTPASVRHAMIAQLHELSPSLYNELLKLPFHLSGDGKVLLHELYGTPPSHYDKGDGLKYFGDLLGRALDSLIHEWLSSASLHSDHTPSENVLMEHQHFRSTPPKSVLWGGDALNVLCEALDEHAPAFVSGSNACIVVRQLLLEHLLLVCQHVLSVYLASLELQPDRQWLMDMLLQRLETGLVLARENVQSAGRTAVEGGPEPRLVFTERKLGNNISHSH